MSDVRMHSTRVLCCLAIVIAGPASGQVYLMQPERVFDGTAMHDGWSVLVEDGRIAGVGPLADLPVPERVESVELPGTTLLA